MPTEETLDALEPRLQQHIKKAQKALEAGRTDYTTEICLSVLKRHPGCITARQLLHDAHKNAPIPAYSPVARVLIGAFHFFQIAYATISVYQRPLKTLTIVERVLCDDPGNLHALRLMGKAADRLGFPQTTRIAYQALLEFEPEKPANAVALGKACLACNHLHQAVALGQRALGLDPACREAQDLVKKAAVAISMGKDVASSALTH